jgi:hypothetical protein
LGQEFGIFDLAAHCSDMVPDAGNADPPLNSVVAELTTTILSQMTQFESFRRDFPVYFSSPVFSRLEKLEGDILELRDLMPREVEKLELRIRTDLSVLKSKADQFRLDIDEINSAPHIFPVTPNDPLNGIIAYLTEKHGGNLHDKGIVVATSKSGKDVRNVVDLRFASDFKSGIEADQWASWEFREWLIRPTWYVIRASVDNIPKSWVLEASQTGDE